MSDFPSGGVVVTVEGQLNPDDLGITLIHEHTLIDLRCYRIPPRTDRQMKYADTPLSMQMLGDARRDIAVFPDALVLDDPDLALEEVREFATLGGRTVVDVTPTGVGRNVRTLRRIAQAAGLNYVVACGYYVARSHPPEVAEKSVEELTELLLQEISEGIDHTDIRPGIIGEIGMSQPVHPDEWKVLTAACRAQVQTGLPLSIHPHFGTTATIAPEVVKHILRQGVSPQRVNACHMEGAFLKPEYQLRVADMGVYISFDTFGFEMYYDGFDYSRTGSDADRERALLYLLERGYEDQVMISQDVCTKLHYQRYGGYGYGHILRHIVPSLQHQGVSDLSVERILVENPRRFLTIS